MNNMQFFSSLCAAVLIGFVSAVPPSAHSQQPALRPDQARVLEIVLRDVEPGMRPYVREQMTQTLAPLNESQIQLMIDGLAANVSTAPEEIAVADDAPAEISPEDLAYNRAQYEPVIRKAHAVQSEFDALINQRLGEYCPDRDSVARWGSGWRYELPVLKHDRQTASDSADIDVAVLGGSYAPQDGRYKFDFSKVRMTFDAAKVDAAVKLACDAYKTEGRTFLTKLDPLIAKQDWNAAFRLEQDAQNRVEPIRAKLDDALNKLSPAADYALFTALQQAERVR